MSVSFIPAHTPPPHTHSIVASSRASTLNKVKIYEVKNRCAILEYMREKERREIKISRRKIREYVCFRRLRKEIGRGKLVMPGTDRFGEPTQLPV